MRGGARNTFKTAVQSYEAKEIVPSGGEHGSRGGGKYDLSSAGCLSNPNYGLIMGLFRGKFRFLRTALNWIMKIETF